MNKFIPRNKVGDLIYTYLSYFIIWKRFPVRGTFNHFIISQKLSDENFELKKKTTDKNLSKKFLKEIALNKYIVPTVFYSTNINKLINSVFEKKHIKILSKEKTNYIVIKPSNSQGKIIKKKIKLGECLKDILNKEEIELLYEWYSQNYYVSSRDRCYKDLNPGIIIEPLIDNKLNLKDYKFHLIKDKIKIIQVDADRFTDHYRNLYDQEFKKLNFSIAKKWKKAKISKPVKFNEMKKIACKIGKKFNYCRVDMFLRKNGTFCIGEITHHHGNGEEPFYDENNLIVKNINKEISLSKFFLNNQN